MASIKKSYYHLEGKDNQIKTVELKNYKSSRYYSGDPTTGIGILERFVPKNAYLIFPGYYHEGFYTRDLDSLDTWQAQISGKIKLSETPLQAAQREVIEEIGLIIPEENFKLVHEEKYVPHTGNFRNIHYYLADLDFLPGDIKNPDDILEESMRRSMLTDNFQERVIVFAFTRFLNKTVKTILLRKRLREDSSQENIHDAGHLIFLVPFNQAMYHTNKISKFYNNIKN